MEAGTRILGEELVVVELQNHCKTYKQEGKQDRNAMLEFPLQTGVHRIEPNASSENNTEAFGLSY
jgi:hypothetical protein